MAKTGIYRYMPFFPFASVSVRLNHLYGHCETVMVSRTQDPKVLGELNRESSQALYSQLEEMIRESIESGRLAPGEAIPSERELSRGHGLSRMTVRRALDRLVAAGLLYRVDGKGTFVSQPKVSFQALSLGGLHQQALQLGHSPSVRLLGIEKVLAPLKIADVLSVTPDAPVFLMERVHLANGEPFAMHRSYIPCELCPQLLHDDLVNNSLYTVLKEKYGIQIHRASETLESTLATNRESLLLGVSPGSPMLLLRITLYDPEEHPIEYVKVVFRGDRVQLKLSV
ncbi:MAG: GntR family transcriptional regulator [Ardenticatenaceae bacterium]|nr:GntR family transcriptional regulator [Ardenticatenaceae bacterium]